MRRTLFVLAFMASTLALSPSVGASDAPDPYALAAIPFSEAVAYGDTLTAEDVAYRPDPSQFESPPCYDRRDGEIIPLPEWECD